MCHLTATDPALCWIKYLLKHQSIGYNCPRHRESLHLLRKHANELMLLKWQLKYLQGYQEQECVIPFNLEII